MSLRVDGELELARVIARGGAQQAHGDWALLEFPRRMWPRVASILPDARSPGWTPAPPDGGLGEFPSMEKVFEDRTPAYVPAGALDYVQGGQQVPIGDSDPAPQLRSVGTLEQNDGWS